MTPTEMVAFEKQQYALFSDGLESALAGKNYALAVMKLHTCFNSCVLRGLIQWRHGLEDPTGALREALTVARCAAESLPVVDPTQPHRQFFYFPAALYLCYLIDRRSDSLLENVSYRFERQQESGLDYCGPHLDAGVLVTLCTGSRPAGWDDYLAAVAKRRRFALLQETSACYVEIIENAAQGKVADVATKIQKAATLFWKRARNSAYDSAGGGTDGGGPDNEHVVDFRLAALIRMCLPDQGASLTGDAAVHVWRWS